VASIVKERILGELACLAGRTMCFINADGNVYPCPYLIDRRTLAGNIRRKGFKDIWYFSKLFKTIRDFDIDKIDNCSKCILKSICQGGCRASSLIKYGDLNHSICCLEPEALKRFEQ